MKVSYIGKNAKALEWSTTEELQELCAEYGISLGANAIIGDECRIACGVDIGTDAWIGHGVRIGHDAVIEDRVRIDAAVVLEHHVQVMSDAEIGHDTRIAYRTSIGRKSIIGNCVSISDHVWIKDDNNIGNNVIIGYNASTGDGVHISQNVWVPITTNIPDGHHIERIVTIYNAYQYNSSVWLHKGALFVAMGCHTQNEDAWNDDFWNNDNEFPEGSEPATKRLGAYHNIVAIGHQVFKDDLT